MSVLDFELFHSGKYRHITEESDGVKYEGHAPYNALESDSSWSIKRFVTSGIRVYEDRANKGEFSCVWDNRSTYFPGAIAFGNKFATEFDGINDYASTANASATVFSGITNEFAVSLWVNPSNLDGTYRTIFLMGPATASSNGTRCGIRIRNTSIVCEFVSDIGGSGNVTASIIPTNGQWMHIVAQKKGVVWELYVNSVLMATATYGAVVFTPTMVTMGMSRRDVTFPTTAFSGRIDEVLVVNRYLTAPEIVTIFNGGKTGSPSFLGENLVAWYRMGDNDTFPILKCGVNATNDVTMYNMLASAFVVSGV